MDPDLIREIFQSVGPLRIRKMFGGHGIYRDELMFALEADGELYLKADGETVEAFRNLGSRPFTYSGRNGRTATMSYWLMPETAFEDPDEAAQLARMALAAAQRAARRGKAKGAGRTRRKAAAAP